MLGMRAGLRDGGSGGGGGGATHYEYQWLASCGIRVAVNKACCKRQVGTAEI